mgnify:CR=1 FL=1
MIMGYIKVVLFSINSFLAAIRSASNGSIISVNDIDFVSEKMMN